MSKKQINSQGLSETWIISVKVETKFLEWNSGTEGQNWNKDGEKKKDGRYGENKADRETRVTEALGYSD